jgi:Uma2 family endonuclease
VAIELRLNPITDNELLAISRANPGYRFERSAEGKLLVTPTSLLPSGGEGELFGQVRDWVKRTGLGRAFPATGGFTLRDSGIKAADTSYFDNERLVDNLSDTGAFPHMAPTVAFELLSPEDTVKQTQAKVKNYIDNGVSLGVIINPDTTEVLLLRPAGEWVVCNTPTIEIGPEMPGFVLDVAEIVHQQRQGI